MNYKDIFSETFELNSLSRWTTSKDANSILATSSTVAKSGSYSLKVEYKQNGSYALLKKYMGAAYTDFYLKFWIYLPADYTQVDTNVPFFDLKDVNWGMEFEGFMSKSGDNIIVRYKRTGGDAVSVNTSIVITKGSWTCLEFHIVKHASAGVVEIFKNGDNGYSATGLNTGVDGVRVIEIGSGWTTTDNTGYPVYYDDIEFAESRVGTRILKGAISFNFDDGESGVYTYARSIFNNAGYKPTCFIITDYVGGSGYMTSAQLQTLYSEGWEMGSHTVNHIDLTAADDTTLTSELVDSKSYLEGLGFVVKSFASPMGAYNDIVLAKIAKYYLNHRTADDGNESFPTNDYSLKIKGVYGGTTPTAVQGWINEIIASGQRMLLIFHNVVDSNPTTYQYADENLQTIVTFLSGKYLEVLPLYKLIQFTEPS